MLSSPVYLVFSLLISIIISSVLNILLPCCNVYCIASAAECSVSEAGFLRFLCCTRSSCLSSNTSRSPAPQ
jgi:hypothetical protein